MSARKCSKLSESSKLMIHQNNDLPKQRFTKIESYSINLQHPPLEFYQF